MISTCYYILTVRKEVRALYMLIKCVVGMQWGVEMALVVIGSYLVLIALIQFTDEDNY